MKKKKPTKRQKAILQFLGIVDNEGLDYAIVHYGVGDEVAALNDPELTELVEKYREVAKAVEAKVEELQKEVEPLLEDDSDF